MDAWVVRIAMIARPHAVGGEAAGGISLNREVWSLPRQIPAAGSRARQAVPAAALGVTPTATCDRPRPILRRPGWPERSTCLLPPRDAAPREAVGRLRQAAVFRAAGSTRLFVAIHPLRRYLQPSADRARSGRGHFRDKDYRCDGADRQRSMTLGPDELIRSCLLHVRPKGFHRIRHYGSLDSTGRKGNIARVRVLLAVPAPTEVDDRAPLPDPFLPCPCCSGRMVIIEIFQPAARARTTIVVSPYREHGVMIQRSEPQPPLKPWRFSQRFVVHLRRLPSP